MDPYNAVDSPSHLAHGLRAGVELPLWALLSMLLTVASAVLLALVWRRRLRTFEHRARSGDVRRGRVVEALAPLLDDFPIDVFKPGTNTVFLGQPVDFVHFDPDEGVVFVEVKSGLSTPSERQRRLQNLVERGGVRWTTYRLR
jgi:hypothetical protein